MIRSNVRHGARAALRAHLLLRFAELPVGTSSNRAVQSAERAVPTTRAPRVRVRLTGAPQLVFGDGPAHELERREAALLALIAIEGPTPRSKAAALLWADADTDRQRSSLRQRIFQLRRRAGCDVIPAGEVLALAQTVEHDLTAIAPRLADDPDAGSGELLGDFDYSDCPGLDEWVSAAREQWRTARMHALAEVAARLEAESRVAAALPYAERLVAEDPTLEHAHRRLMRLHYLRGDRAAALAAFERCRQLLRLQLGVEPGTETLELAHLIERSGALPQVQARPVPIAILRPPRLVGRDAEWERLATAVSSCGTAIVAGEPGIGKSRLISDYAATVEGALVIDARPGDARIPYAVLARVLRALAVRPGISEPGWYRGELARLVPEFGAPNTGRLEAGALHRAIAGALARSHAAGLTLIAIDDAHYADEATISALPVLAGGKDARVAWIVGCRSGEIPPPLAEWLASGDREVLAEIRLGPLPQTAVETLLEALEIPHLDARQWAAPLWRHTGGNPLFVLETLRALIVQGTALLQFPAGPLPAPPDIGELIGRRLKQLGPGALGLARIAAIAGQDFSAELAAHVLGRTVVELADDWTELENAHVIRDRAFAHDLICEAVLRSVPQAIAQALHRAIAAHLRSGGCAPARVASHWRDAHEWEAAATAFEAAADEALHTSRREDELQLVEQAIACADESGDRARAFRLRSRAVDAMLIVRPIDAALMLTDRLLVDAANDTQRLDAQLRRAYTLLMANRFVDAVDVAGAARALAQRLGQSRAELDAVRFEALGLANSRRAPEAVRMLRAATPRFDQGADLLQQYKFATDFGHALSQAGLWREAIGAIMRAVELAERLGDVAETIVNLTNLAGASGYVGRMADGVVQAERARSLRDRVGAAIGAPMAHNDMILGMLYVALGRYREALQAFEHADQQFRIGGAPMWTAVNENHRALALIQLGQAGRALKLLAPDSALPLSTQARRLTVLARAEQTLGRSGKADLLAAIDLLGEAGSAVLRMGAQLDLARELAPTDGAALSHQVGAEAERADLLAIAQTARIREIDCLLRANDRAQAASLAQAMLERLQDCHPSDVYLAEVWWAAFRAFDAAASHRSKAREVLHRGVAWINEVAAHNVPDAFRDSFLSRNPVNRALLTAATRAAT
jgi:DNA-binding SARP family transcriptional activator